MSRCFIEYDTEPVALLSWQRVKQLQQSRRPTARCVYCWWAWSTWFAVTSSLHYRPTLRQARTWTVLRHHVTSQMVVQAVTVLLPFRPNVPSSFSCSLPEVCGFLEFRSAASPRFPNEIRGRVHIRGVSFVFKESP